MLQHVRSTQGTTAICSNIILDSRVTGQEARFSLKGQMILDTDGQRRDRDRLRAKLEIRPQDTAETYLTLEGYLFPRSQADGPLRRREHWNR